MALQLKVHKLNGIVPSDAEEEKVVPVARAIVRTVHPESWESMGGLGTIAAVKVDATNDKLWRLVILSEHQAEITSLLNDIRQ